jgi:hypothetical protein
MSKKEKIILFLGNADSEAATAKLKATNRLYKRKMLESGVENWLSIIGFFDDFDVTCVVAKLTSASFNAIASDEYVKVVNALLTRISQVPNLILAHDSLLSGIQPETYKSKPVKYDTEYEEYLGDMDNDYHAMMFDLPSSVVITKVKNTLQKYNLKVLPYSKNVELSVITSSFIEQNEHNLIFRVYVPSERIWASEAEKLLQLFRDYLQKASGLSARHDQYKTNNGVVHEFFGDDEVATSSLTEKFQEFSTFMDTCVNNPELAEKSLISSNLNNKEVSDLVSKYGKEARRLHIDLKHERERKLLNIRQNLEADLSEFVKKGEDWDIIYKIVEDNIPPINGVSSALIGASRVLPITTSQNIFINPQIIETVNSIVAKEISGTINLAPEAKQLISAIEEHSEEKDKSELTSAVHELTDENVKGKDRITAKHKLKSFLITAGSKVGDVSVGILQSFIENQIGL